MFLLSPGSAVRLIVAVMILLQLGCSPEPPLELNKASKQAAPLIRQAKPALSAEYAAMRKQQIERVDYQLSVALDSERDLFEGQVTINFDLAAGNVSPVTVDFNNGTVKAVTLNGKPVEWDYNNWFISLAADLFVDGNNSLQINYAHKYSADGSGLYRFKDPETTDVYLYTDFEPYSANRLFPHFDQPNLKAVYELDVVAPLDWTVISVTREHSIVDNEKAKTRHWHFPKSAKISSYIFALHAGPYHMWQDQAGDIPLRLFARQSLAKHIKIDDWFTPTRQSFAFFNEYFSLPYPFVKYDQVIVPDFNSGAMENVGAVTFSEGYVKRGEKTTDDRLRLANVIAHEMAHMWFGNLVTMDWWNGLWLNESFATYMANLELEKASDFDNVWDVFYAKTKQWAYQTDQLVTTHAIELPVPTTADAFTNFDGITYGKGASVLKQLSHYLGEQQFRKGVSAYLKKYAYQNTSLDDFINELALAADKNLTQWQQQWLYETGLNTITLDFSCDNGLVTKMELLQTAPAEWPTLRQQRVQVGLYQLQGNSMQLDALIPVTYSGAVTVVTDAAGQQCPDLAYPNVGDWGYVNVQVDDQSLHTLKQHINAFEKPGLRIMLWQNLWDSVRNAEMSLDDYVQFSVTNIADETDKNVVRQVSNSLLSAYSYLTKLSAQKEMDSKNKQRFNGLRLQIEQFAWQQLLKAEPASDSQKQWFAIGVASTHSSDGLEKAISLLAGDLVIEGLVVDQDKRWQLVIALNHYEYKNYDALLLAEKKRDDSALGAKMAIAAEVIRPQVALKEKWLATVIDSLTASEPEAMTYNLSALRYAMSSFFPAGQQDSVELFSEKILAAMPVIDKQSSPEVIRSYARLMMPSACNKDSVKRLARAIEEFSDLTPITVKAFKVGHQEDQRCVDIGGRLLTVE